MFFCRSISVLAALAFATLSSAVPLEAGPGLVVARLDCAGFGPGPYGPGSGPMKAEPDPILQVQVQAVSGPDLNLILIFNLQYL